MKAVYIHIPFCKSICSYCDFCKVFYHQKWVHDYFNALRDEIMDRYMGEKISTIYIGGGTPSCLSLRELEYLMEIVKLFYFDDTIEFTFECNLNDINEEMLSILKENNVNRLSIGIQSFQRKKLNIMGRNHTFREASDKIQLAREMDFLNINVDLMYGMPYETLKDLKKDLKLFFKLKPDHISTYSLILSSHTLLHVNQMKEIDEELEAKMYQYLCKKLKGKYHHYEVSNFALRGMESKHNLNYWNNQEYYGFGVSASGFIDNIRYTNTKNLLKYMNGNYDDTKDILSKQDIMDHEVMLGLRKMQGISLREFQETYGVALEDAYPILPLLKNKELMKKNGYIFINPDKIYVMNEILIKII